MSGLTEEELLEGKVQVVEQKEGVNVEPGEEATGTITGGEVTTYEMGDETLYYYRMDIEIDGAFTMNHSVSLNGGNIHEGTTLGVLIDRFGTDLDDFRNTDKSISLNDVFVDRDVRFEVDEDEEGYNVVAEDDDGMPKLHPEDSDVDIDAGADEEEEEEEEEAEEEESDDSEEADDDLEGRVFEVVAENEGEEESSVKATLARENGQLIATYNKMKERGDITVEDGEVSL